MQFFNKNVVPNIYTIDKYDIYGGKKKRKENTMAQLEPENCKRELCYIMIWTDIEPVQSL